MFKRQFNTFNRCQALAYGFASFTALALGSAATAQNREGMRHPCTTIDAANDSQSGNIWPGGIVPIEFDANVTALNITRFNAAAADISAVANITFVPFVAQANYIHVQDNPNFNNSAIGMQGGQQIINIASWDFEYIIVHELLHALGFLHTQSRQDRDTFVTINFGNIQGGFAGNFVQGGTDHGPYDFQSVMHYAQCDFANACLPNQTCNNCAGAETIVVLPPNQALQGVIGQRDRLSAGDIGGLIDRYGPAIAGAQSCGGAITINDNTTATPYPSAAIVTGIGGTLTNLTVTLNSITHTFPDDIDILLVGPQGQTVILMSDAGDGDDIANVTLTFDDAAANNLPNGSQISSGTFQPSNFGAGVDAWPTAPAGPYGAALADFIGTNPNGTWNLFVVDDNNLDVGSIGSWCLNIQSTCVIDCPANITLPNDPNQCGAVVNYNAPFTGTCGTVTCLPASGSVFPVNLTVVTCTPTTGPACSFTVIVQDTQPPTITCPANITVGNDLGQCGAVVNYPAPTVSDNCPGVGAPTCAPASGSFFPVGTTIITCTVNDSSPNSPASTCQFTITVNDTEPPTITCPPTQNVISSTGTCTAVVDFNNLVVTTDNCPGETFACVPASGTVFPMGTTPVTCTATDAALPVGNTATCTFNVIVTCAKRATGTEKGSLLIFSDVELKWNDSPLAGNTLTQDTFIKLSNDNNQAVNVQMYFINGDAPLAQQPPLPALATERAHPGWNNVDNQIHLTADQPTYWSASRGAPATGGLSPWTVLDPGTPPGRPDLDPGAAPGSRYLRGFIIAFAVNASNEQIKWNHLSGSATVVNYALGTAFEYNAWAFQAVNPRIGTGANVGVPGIINFNGFEYARGFDQLLMNFQAVGATAFSGPKLAVSNSDLTLHLLTTDLRQDNDGPRTTKAKFDIWNQNEVKFSNAERCITCWHQGLLGTWAPNANHFLRANLQTNVGRARIDGLISPVVCNNPLFPSTNESLLGIISSSLVFDAGISFAETGTNLFGLGFQEGQIQYDPLNNPPPPAQDDENKDGHDNADQDNADEEGADLGG